MVVSAGACTQVRCKEMLEKILPWREEVLARARGRWGERETTWMSAAVGSLVRALWADAAANVQGCNAKATELRSESIRAASKQAHASLGNQRPEVLRVSCCIHVPGSTIHRRTMSLPCSSRRHALLTHDGKYLHLRPYVFLLLFV